ncbi:PilC/PilY family type IV pilus protein [SCandidatus Aminicenantes bacterium Aminicenantia_JdfR_composite]|nr:PilC/PilY family type IV pilus protein [SCandidatus Aminicenantes bacterium Aminicenantia_JdfR_composite]MCP2596287.1 PilC/PilY family type IV pilus protein [Candidatus Aminicenantes bacterium AC-335-G13]MCP2597862.1 PilC/PilY family type IV pilus protein [Candidatus Aminicenantes bacterium AC-335-L06]MCP2620481.1 PilC/PilY family type IV pilus protein [Candidatus Aminicenantes bacterium AC-334-E05]
MTKKRKIFLLIIPVSIILVFAFKFLAQNECIEYNATFIESFDNTTYKDFQNSSVAHWGDGYITLNRLGAQFEVASPTGMGAKIYVCDAGDFDGDGYPDLIGLDIANNYRLILIRNYYEDLDGDGQDDDGVIFYIDENEVYDWGLTVGPASITVADYNNDGLLDFFFYKNRRDEFGYTEFVAAMYINIGTSTDPDFRRYFEAPNLNFTDRFMEAGIYCNWAADHLSSIDIDNDGDIDVLVISQDKIFLVRNPGPQNFDLNNFEISELNYNQRTGFTIGRGGSSIDAADFDNDGDIDIVGGTVNDIAYLVYYENDGTGYFTRSEIPIPNPDATGTVATCVADFNLDGFIDIFGATDRWNAGNEARMWIFKNINGTEFQFRCLNGCNPILPPPHDVDMSACLDYDQDGDMDVILADANHSGDYYLIINQLAPVYTLTGIAQSTNLSDQLNPEQYAITKVRFTSLQQTWRGTYSSDGLRIDYYVSNDNGRNWEFYASFIGDEIRNQTNLPWHTFHHFGSQLKWKAILSAPDDNMVDYENASYETPVIGEVRIEYVYVDKREYSRTSVAATTVEINGETKKLIIAGSFIFPGWEGHLRAYDVTNMTAQNTTYTTLRTISRSDLSSPTGREIVAQNVQILWDAGELLASRSPDTRNIYTAVFQESSFTRIDFSADNVDVLGPILQDVNNDNVGLINFIRGEGRDWKLGDINHSNPIVVGPPEGVSSLMGPGYDTFKQTWANRPKVVYVGANDGMLHCFDARTGEELWAFIPYNLLPKLRNMWAVDPNTGERYFNRDVYVDGSPTVADVYINGEWRTVLICGQGPGKGSSIGGCQCGQGNCPNESEKRNYYFALDITDPYNPQPLWEFTDSKLGETWSVPAIGKIRKDGKDVWVAFVGSGYDNDDDPRNYIGNYFYAIDIEDGWHYFWRFEAPEVDTTAENGFNIQNTIPGSPSIIDINSDGYADRVYVGDLDGRIWKINVSIEFRQLRRRRTTWQAEIIYEDSNNYPIISKPTAWINPYSQSTIPRIYFGTGGDDNAPSDVTYSFIALMDNEASRQENRVEWFIGDPTILNLPASKDRGDLAVGEKVWSDPQVANYIVYFNTLSGSIESVNPCENLAGMGKLYARFVQSVAGSTIGGTAFTGPSGPPESLTLASKTRSAVTLGERIRTSGGARKREVYIQEYDSTIQKLEQPIGAILKVRSWREIFKIIRNPYL